MARSVGSGLVRLTGRKPLWLLAAAALLLAPGAVARPAADGPLVLVSATAAPAWRAFSPDGTRMRRFAPNVHVSSASQISPDGRFVVTGEGRNTVLRRSDGARVATLGSSGGVEGNWSPDASRYALVDGRTLRVHDVRGRVVLELHGGFRWDAPVWNGSSSAVAVRPLGPGGEPYSETLEVVAVPSGQRRVLARDASSTGETAWSPTGDVVAYTTADGGVALLALADGSRALARAPTHFELAWSPDGLLVAIALLDGGLEVVDRAARRVLHVPPQTSDWRTRGWAWEPGGRLTYLTGDGIASHDPVTGERRMLVSEKRGRAITGFSWSPDGSQLAFERERLPGIGQDVFVLGAGGTERRLTSPFPDGASSGVVGWLHAPAPPPVKLPSTRPASVAPVAHVPAVARVLQGGPRRIHATLAPEDSPTSAVSAGCGTLFPTGGSPFDTCGVGDYGVLGAAATTAHFAWVAEHLDEGAGDEHGACLYVLPLAEGARPKGLGGCYPERGARQPITSVFGGWIDVKAAGAGFAVGLAHDEDWGRDRVLVWQAGKLRRLATARRTEALHLLDADGGRVLVRWGASLRLLRLDGRLLVSRPLGRERIVGAALDGSSVVLLRPAALERYDARTLRLRARVTLAAAPGRHLELLGAHGGVAAYLRGTVVSLVRFRDGRRVALRVPDAVPPISGALTRTGLTLAYQREAATPSGLVARVDLASALPPERGR